MSMGIAVYELITKRRLHNWKHAMIGEELMHILQWHVVTENVQPFYLILEMCINLARGSIWVVLLSCQGNLGN
ncbi:hypothetical protein VIGAN_04330400 [Vigna angularis var. angularis]|uniref:Uncharacterized protein n=1 Tax=Vigna angularis var. angularis TaxID=157739 RepID=A0A0S3RYQ9_PHAAN|nr:hypothetical protein VIGAN_04330400 [Vigna angularis var. angularis]